MIGRLLVAAVLSASPIYAQEVVLAPVHPEAPAVADGRRSKAGVDDATLTSTIEADLLHDLPTSASLFQVLETTQPSVISDRFSGGGLFAGQAARVGGFFGSSSQTLYRIGEATISDPTGSGTPLAFPDLTLWQRAHVTTGMMPVDTNALGLAVTLVPLEPGDRWVRTMTGTSSRGPLGSTAPATTAPSVVRLGTWDQASATAAGPLIDGRLGGAFAVSWNSGTQFHRTEPSAVDAEQGSAFAHLVFAPSAHHEIRTIGWLQWTTSPSALRTPLGLPDASTKDRSGHAQVSWERRPEGSIRLRLVGAYTERKRSPGAASSTGSPRVVFERLADGPLSEVIWSGASTVRQWSVGAKALPSAIGRAPRVHTMQAGLELSGARAVQEAGISGPVGELVNGLPARVWMFTNPGTDSLHRATTMAAHVGDQMRLGARLSLEAGLAFDAVFGSAEGAATNVAWTSLLPRVSLRWTVTNAWGLTAFAGYRRSAYRLPLDLLAVGDPSAPTADVFRWEAPAGGSPSLDARGPLVVRAGPGSGGSATFSAIDSGLKRPYLDEVVLGIEAHPLRDLTLRLIGVKRRERDAIGLVNFGAPESAYSVIGVPDIGVDVLASVDDGVVAVYNRRPETFGQDRYLLTNPDQADSTSESIEVSVQLTMSRVLIFVGGSASRTDGPAANRGYGPLENDEGIIGELFTNPNAAVHARGRLFNDRAYTGKAISVFRLPKDFRLGLLMRYQDGQAFSRVVVMPGLSQGAEAVRAFANGGSRFTYVGTMDARLQKSILAGRFRADVIVDAYNLPNMSNEVEEDIVTGPGFRTVTAVQPSRSFHVGVRLSF